MTSMLNETYLSGFANPAKNRIQVMRVEQINGLVKELGLDGAKAAHVTDLLPKASAWIANGQTDSLSQRMSQSRSEGSVAREIKLGSGEAGSS
ncbi:hypothetical protein SAE02_72710 [Skermanella aerolata]|uniref:Uncharacterized protein n=1 Tax=Skermanella aerolata TaxID=393310 RepID=A0A512E317_9PROT|nr:hypothetical protein [Skermanella aerolata]KJB90261.1 hypothetical protein N826_38810 [Skermanella aerolata KACC 11604]GEO43123.1 hypothetical protein SAE02_72710 [Skermanella aerolata]